MDARQCAWVRVIFNGNFRDIVLPSSERMIQRWFNTDAGFVLGTGKILLKVPETMRFYLEGELPPGLMAKDVILHVIGDIGFDGATYRAM